MGEKHRGWEEGVQEVRVNRRQVQESKESDLNAVETTLDQTYPDRISLCASQLALLVTSFPAL